MARKQNLLNDLRLREAVEKTQAAKTTERFNDGDGLILVVTAAGRARFLHRYLYGVGYKSVWLEGTYPRDVSLSEARQWRDANARLLDERIDPAAARKTGAKANPTLAEYARTHFARLAPPLDQRKAAKANGDLLKAPWFRDVAIHCGPLAKMKIDLIRTSHIEAALGRYWKDDRPTPTATRLVATLARILKHRHTLQRRDAPYWQNPADFEALCDLLGRRIHYTKHRPSLPFADVPAFVAKVRADPTMSARLLEWVILTGCRANEACGATWGEIDWKRRLWVIPPERLKTEKNKDAGTGKPFAVPLSIGMVRVLKRAAENRVDFAPGDLLFPGMGMFRNAPCWRRAGCPVQPYTTNAVLERVKLLNPNVTTHGFRSSFVAWGIAIPHRRRAPFTLALMDRSIGHIIGAETADEGGKARLSAALGSYANNGEDPLLTQRRAVMREWSAYIDGTVRAKVAPIGSTVPHTLRLVA